MAPSDLEVTGSVHSWDISIGVDGPGVRFAAFLAGCPLKCRYCHSPDTQTMRSGTRRSVGDLMAEIEQYEDFIGTNGGVTVTGGEPLLQPRFAGALLRMCKQNGLHTALDTSGYLGARADDALLDATDLVLLDVKSWGEARYRELTGRPLAPTLRFARRLADRGMPMWIRFVLVPGLTDGPEVVEGWRASSPACRPSSASRCCRSTAWAPPSTPSWASSSRCGTPSRRTRSSSRGPATVSPPTASSSHSFQSRYYQG
ncbi:radical SAM protein [Luedemannella flava]